MLENNVQTLLKTETGYQPADGRMKAQAQSLPKSMLTFETCQIPLFSLSVPTLPLYLPTWRQLSFSPEVKYVANGDCFSKRNLWSGSRKSKSLASDLPLESHLTGAYKRRRLCSGFISWQSCSKPLLSSSDIFRLASISVLMTQYIESHSDTTCLTRVVKRESRPIMVILYRCMDELSVHAYTDTK